MHARARSVTTLALVTSIGLALVRGAGSAQAAGIQAVPAVSLRITSDQGLDQAFDAEAMGCAGGAGYTGFSVSCNGYDYDLGTATLDSIPLLPDGNLDPAFDPETGNLKSGATPSPQGFIPDAGHVYATALELSGISKANQTGKNNRAPMTFVKK